MTKVLKYGLPAMAVFWVCAAIFALILSIAYDGGPVCFVVPKRCEFNQPDVAILPAPSLTPTSTHILASPTLWLTPTQWVTPTPGITTTPEEVFIVQRGEFEPVDCGRDPYKYNHFEQKYERPFTSHCFEHTNDPFDAIFGGNGWEDGPHYGEVMVVLNMLNIADKPHFIQVQILHELDIWNYNTQTAVSPEELNEILHTYLREQAEEEVDDKDIEDD